MSTKGLHWKVVNSKMKENFKSEEFKNKYRKPHKMTDLKTFKKNRSLATKKMWEDGRMKNRKKGVYPSTPEFKKLRSEISSRLWDDPKYVKKVFKGKTLTRIHQKLIEILKELGIVNFQIEYKVKTSTRKYFLDVAFPNLKIDLEADGEHWHDPIEDVIRDINLKSLGWKVFRFTGSELVMEPIQVKEKLKDIFELRSSNIH